MRLETEVQNRPVFRTLTLVGSLIPLIPIAAVRRSALTRRRCALFLLRQESLADKSLRRLLHVVQCLLVRQNEEGGKKHALETPVTGGISETTPPLFQMATAHCTAVSCKVRCSLKFTGLATREGISSALAAAGWVRSPVWPLRS